jgi:hypothetical protein
LISGDIGLLLHQQLDPHLTVAVHCRLGKPANTLWTRRANCVDVRCCCVGESGSKRTCGAAERGPTACGGGKRRCRVWQQLVAPSDCSRTMATNNCCYKRDKQ